MVKKIFVFLTIVVIISTMILFNFYIQKQSKLDIVELEQIVEKEIQETHAKK